MRSSILPSSEIFIAMSQGNQSSLNSSSSDEETIKDDYLFSKMVSDSARSGDLVLACEEESSCFETPNPEKFHFREKIIEKHSNSLNHSNNFL